MNSFEKNGYRFEDTTHQLGGPGDIDYLKRTFADLELTDLPLVRSRYLFEACLAGDSGIEHRYLIPSDRNELQRELSRRFPGESAQIEGFLDSIEGVHGDLTRLMRLQREKNKLPILHDSITALLMMRARKGGALWKLGASSYKHLVKHGNETYAEMIDSFSPRLASVLSQYWPFVGVPPSRTPAILMAMIWNTYLRGGPHHVVGGTGRLIERLVSSVTDNGGEILYGTPVKTIVVDGNRAKGVITDDGSFFEASSTVSNISTHRTFLELMEPSLLPDGFVDRIRELEMSPSAFQVYVGASLRFEDFGFQSSTMFMSFSEDVESQYSMAVKGPKKTTPMFVTNFSMLDADAAPKGCCSFLICELDSFDRWKNLTRTEQELLEEDTQKFMMEKFERVTGMPIRQKAAVVHSWNPLTIMRHSSGIKGEIYGPAAIPGQSLRRRTPQITPIRDLHLVGAYAQQGHGVCTVLDSGVLLGKLLAKG